MNFLFYCCEFPPQAGGVGSYMFNMASALRQSGYGTVVVTSRGEGLPAEEELECGPVYRLYDRSEKYAAKTRDAVLAVARQHHVDLIEGADHHGEAASLLGQRGRPAVLVKIHGSNPIRILQRSQMLHGWQELTVRLAQLRNMRQTAAERQSIERADMALVPSHRMLDELQREGFRLPAKTAVIPNPIRPFSGTLAPEADGPTVLLVGRIDIGKGIQYLPGILRRVRGRHPSVILEMAGEDSYARGLGSMKNWLVRQLGEDARRVRFLGRCDAARMNEAYGRAWAVILPSRWDNFPTVLLEAAVRGKPVVASPNGGMPEMLDGTLCRTAPPESPEFADRIAGLLADSKARSAAGQSVRAKVLSAYSPKAVLEQYLAFVKSSFTGRTS